MVDGLTIVRTRGEMLFSLRSTSAVGEGFLVGAALGIVTNDAFAVGVTAVPSPIDDIDWDGWYWHQLVHLFEAVGVSDDGITTNARIQIDSKAMRKIGVNETAFMVIEGAEVGTSVVAAFGLTRMLLKLA